MPIKNYIPLAVKQRVRHLQKKVQLISATHYCPVCESGVVSFLPLPEFFRENLQRYGFPFEGNDAETCNDGAYSCPSCNATDRDRLCALFLSGYLKSLESVAPIKIVDFAPSAPLSEFICRLIKSSGRKIQYRTADLLADNVDDKVDITELHLYQDDEFDFFMCSHVLEHVEDDKKALCELHRILKPGGKAILMVPIILSIDQIDEDTSVVDEGERWRRFGQSDHVRLYSKSGFLARVREAGFQVHEYGRETFGEELFNKAGISSQSVLYVVEK
jgi:predicted SAM-dependent methyltransferase